MCYWLYSFQHQSTFLDSLNRMFFIILFRFSGFSGNKVWNRFEMTLCELCGSKWELTGKKKMKEKEQEKATFYSLTCNTDCSCACTDFVVIYFFDCCYFNFVCYFVFMCISLLDGFDYLWCKLYIYIFKLLFELVTKTSQKTTK